MELTPSEVQQAKNLVFPDTRNKRRNDAINAVQEPDSAQHLNTTPSTSFPGERASKRRGENSVEVATTVPKQYPHYN